jgi:hypothetical protein
VLATLLQDLDPAAPALFSLNEMYVSFIVAVIIPVILGFVLNDNAPNWVKVVLGGAVTVAATLLKEAIQSDGSAVFSQEFVVQFFMIYIPQVALYYGFWKPLDINRVTGQGIINVKAKETPVNRTGSTARTP